VYIGVCIGRTFRPNETLAILYVRLTLRLNHTHPINTDITVTELKNECQKPVWILSTHFKVMKKQQIHSGVLKSPPFFGQANTLETNADPFLVVFSEFRNFFAY
jgi:hypothetical protein